MNPTQQALRDAWEAVNVLGAPASARSTEAEREYCAALEDVLADIELLQQVASERREAA